MTKILFVCMGNICRSPAAEGVMKALVLEHNLADKIYCESAGTSGHHVGDEPDGRMKSHAEKRGVNLDSKAQQFVYEHFQKFDFIVTMDAANFKNVLRLDPAGEFKDKVVPMSHLCVRMSVNEVPDPYYGNLAGFERVLELCEAGAQGLLKAHAWIL